MVDWKSPSVQFHTGRALSLISHIFFGIYLWEWLTTLYYDREIIIGRRKRGFGAALYLLARYTSLASFATGIALFNVIHEINCTPITVANAVLAYVSVAFTSGLLYLRVCAVSGYARPVVVGLGVGYAGFWAMSIFSTTKGDAYYVAPLFLCAPLDLFPRRVSTLYHLSFDVTCLLTMIFYLLKMHGMSLSTSRNHAGGLWRLIVQQGFIYFVAICTAYTCTATLLMLNLNDAVSQIPMVCTLSIASIAATRMHRRLDEFLSSPQPVNSRQGSKNAKPVPGNTDGDMSFIATSAHIQFRPSGSHPHGVDTFDDGMGIELRASGSDGTLRDSMEKARRTASDVRLVGEEQDVGVAK